MIINETNDKPKRKPNAADITSGLAKLGGGSKKDGGKGMMGGMEIISQKSYEQGRRDTIADKKRSNKKLGDSKKK